jgi:hypothetical protein
MDINEILLSMRKRALANDADRDFILNTRNTEQPVTAFCEIARKWGYPLYEMDLISAGEDAYAAMRRSTNGGGENSPGLSYEDDYYELFMADLENRRG